MTRRPIALLAAAGVIPLAALSATTASSAAATHTATVRVAHSRLGPILVNSGGRTLYLFKADSRNRSTCFGACATAWPPLLVTRRPTAGTGLTASKLGTIRRSGSRRQVTYNGHPLYLYIADRKPGQTNGQGVTAFGASWFALSPAGHQASVRRVSSANGARRVNGGAMDSPVTRRLRTCLPAGQAKPTVVLVHGAWADASSWSGEVTTLQSAGYDVRAIANPLQDLTTDSEYVADYLKTIEGPVVLVGHSYGGAVITNAAAGLANVKALVYVDASAPAPGETNGQLSGANSILTKDTPAQLFFTTTYPGAPAGASELYLKKDIFVHNFANDLPRAEAERLWASQRGASTVAFGTPSQAAAWMTIPSWYFISTGDQIITAQSELAMARRAHSHIIRFHGGSHLTLISHPNAVTSVIASAVCSLH